MDHRTREPVPGPNETVERREIIERHDRGTAAPSPNRGTSNAIWLLPLLLVVIGLVWFIFARGEPVDTRNLEVNVPQVEVPRVTEERRIEVQVPAGGGTTAPPQTAPPQTGQP
jgi:hypothetical protein